MKLMLVMLVMLVMYTYEMCPPAILSTIFEISRAIVISTHTMKTT